MNNEKNVSLGDLAIGFWSIDHIRVGDAFLVYGGANQHGSGQQIALVNKITKYGNIYCEKFSIRRKKSIGKKCRLDVDDIISRFHQQIWHINDHGDLVLWGGAS